MRALPRFGLVLAGAAAAASFIVPVRPRDTRYTAVTPPFLEIEIPRHPPVSRQTRELGKKLYAANCQMCHGERGTGDGPAAPFLLPRPRDLTMGAYKFRTTEFGLLPTDEDIFRTITRGADGTSMPPWQSILNAEQRWALVDYIKDFCPRFAEGPKPEPVRIPKAPKTAPDLVNGKLLYGKLECAKCHGADGRGDGPSAPFLNDAKGFHVNSRDFTDPASFRSGWTAREIVRALKTGLNGTPLPIYVGLMNQKENYDVAAYVMSMAKAGPGDQKRASARRKYDFGGPDRIISLRERAWKFEPAEICVHRGETVRIDFSATDNGMGAGHGFAIDGQERLAFINGTTVDRPMSVTFQIDAPGRYTYYCATDCSSNELHPRMTGILVVE